MSLFHAKVTFGDCITQVIGGFRQSRPFWKRFCVVLALAMQLLSAAMVNQIVCAADAALSQEDAHTSWCHLRIATQQALAKKQLDLALSDAQSALRLAGTFGEYSVYRAISLRELADVWCARRQPEKAIALLKLENRIVEKVPNSPLLIENLKFTAVLLWDLKQYEESLAYDRKVLDCMRATFGNDDRRTIGQAHLIADIERSKNDLIKSEQFQQQYLTLVNAKGASHADTLKALLTLANWEQDRDMPDKALADYEKAALAGCENPQSFASIVVPALHGAGDELRANRHFDELKQLYANVLASKKARLEPAQRSLLLSQWFDAQILWIDGKSRAEQLKRAADISRQLNAFAATTDDPAVKADAHARNAVLALSRDDRPACRTECLTSLNFCWLSRHPYFETVRVAMEALVNAAGGPFVIDYCKAQLAKPDNQSVPFVPLQYFMHVWHAECERQWFRDPTALSALAEAEHIYSSLLQRSEVAHEKELYGYCALRHAKICYFEAITTGAKPDIDKAIRVNEEFFKEQNEGVRASNSKWLICPTCQRLARLYLLADNADAAERWYKTGLHILPDAATDKDIQSESEKYLAENSGHLTVRNLAQARKQFADFNPAEENP
jgi:tetratricopeptide (TPR) repeat protein